MFYKETKPSIILMSNEQIQPEQMSAFLHSPEHGCSNIYS